jgi:predicted transcriptional regulator
MLTKSTVKQSIENLPDTFTIDELIDQLIFVQKIEEGIKQSDEGKTVSNKDVKKMIEKWSS